MFTDVFTSMDVDVWNILLWKLVTQQYHKWMDFECGCEKHVFM